MTEAELAMEEKLRRKREEEQQVWQEYLKERSAARQKEEDDLRKLKERQQRRKAQRAEQEQIMQEMRRKQDEQRQRELEERRRKEAEAKRQRLEDAERKRLAMQEAIKRRDEEAKRNFSIPRRANGAIPTNAGPMIVGMRDVMKTKEQLAEDKNIAMKYRLKPLKIDDGLRSAEIRKIVGDLWDSIVQLESDKYDLEEEQKRQEYHLKELCERQKQINKNKAIKMGLDLGEDLSSKYPPKVRLASKYERRIDRRSFGEKTELFDGGYVNRVEESKKVQWEDKINQFKENHGDKHVPKWDPSAPRKDVYEPGTVIYEESDEEDDELVGKLRGYVEEARLERKQSNPAVEPIRRRSSQMSNASSVQQQQQQKQQQQAARQQQASRQQQQQQQQQQRRQQEAEEEEEEDEEEYEEEEEEEEEE